jgi:hypothetical protein
MDLPFFIATTIPQRHANKWIAEAVAKVIEDAATAC